MEWYVLVAVLAVGLTAAAVAGAEDEACVPKPGAKWMRANDCCNIGDFLPASMMSGVRKCMAKYPPVRPAGPPPSGQLATPSPEMRSSRACMVECVFTDQHLLTSDKQLDKGAVMKYFSAVKNKDLEPVISAAAEKCHGSYKAEIDTSLDCKSGADEFKRCLTREVFLNCPSSSWASGTECAEFKAKVIKCPQMPVPVGPGPRNNRRN